MPQIIRYKKHITADITREISLPHVGAERKGQELATIGELTYVCLPDDVTLPAQQPTEIANSIEEITLTAALREDIKAASPQVRLINAQVAEKIAASYSMADEIKLLRTAPSAEYEAYNAFAEGCRAWGREQKAALGL
jgi:hypothetical protein